MLQFAGAGSGRIWTNGNALIPLFLSMFADGMPVLMKDFSQSAVDGPRMLPSM